MELEDFKSANALEKISLIYEHYKNDEILLSTSFGTRSAILLDLFDRVPKKEKQKVYFINTGYHFPETIKYQNTLMDRFSSLEFESLRPDPLFHKFTRLKKSWQSYADGCCQVNKVMPMQELKASHEIWVSGLMAVDQDFRSSRSPLEYRGGILRAYPILDWQPDQVEDYFERQELPAHPLRSEGYESVGCTHCTEKGEGRNGRWQGQEKTECGLHYDSDTRGNNPTFAAVLEGQYAPKKKPPFHEDRHRRNRRV